MGFCGFRAESVLHCLVISVLLTISIADAERKEILPRGNGVLFLLSIVRCVCGWISLEKALGGALVISVLLVSVYVLTRGRGIGGGDIKLMAVMGLYLGTRSNLLAFFLGGVYACVIHTVRMRWQRAEREFALAPYLMAGIVTTLWFGEALFCLLFEK